MIEGSGARAISARLTRPLVVCFNTGVSTFQRHPFLVKTVSSGIGFAVGDAFTQLATRRKEEPYDWARTAAMGGAGLCVAGPLGYGFIVWMEGNVMASASTSRLAITTKLTLDQVLGGLLWQAALLSISEQYRGAALGVWQRAQQHVSKKLPMLQPRKLITRT